MPRYHFHITNGHKIVDPSGRELRDRKQAHAEAEHIAGTWEKGKNVEVTDWDGEVVENVPTTKKPQ
jgi:Domain of unknown function (DUF6894)